MSKHSPGPWAANYGGTSGHIKSVSAQYPDGMTPTIAMFDAESRALSIGDHEAEANARLMAAAPEMLDALRQTLKWIESDEMTHGRNFGTGNSIRAAISNATGVTVEPQFPSDEEEDDQCEKP